MGTISNPNIFIWIRVYLIDEREDRNLRMHTSEIWEYIWIVSAEILKYCDVRWIARQRLGKQIPAETYVGKNRTPIVWQRIGKQTFSTIEKLCFLRGPGRWVIKGQKLSLESVVKNWLDFWRCQFKMTEKKWERGIRRWKEDFVCDLKWHWDCYKSVARIRLVKSENPGACVTVNCKVGRLPIAPYCLQS
jgi:hypothetical protein